MNSVFQVMDSILSQWSLDSGFQSLVGFRSSGSCIPDSKATDFVFHNQSFPGFRIPQTKHAWKFLLQFGPTLFGTVRSLVPNKDKFKMAT